MECDSEVVRCLKTKEEKLNQFIDAIQNFEILSMLVVMLMISLSNNLYMIETKVIFFALLAEISA